MEEQFAEKVAELVAQQYGLYGAIVAATISLVITVLWESATIRQSVALQVRKTCCRAASMLTGHSGLR